MAMFSTIVSKGDKFCDLIGRQELVWIINVISLELFPLPDC